jgi:hypothetical protein
MSGSNSLNPVLVRWPVWPCLAGLDRRGPIQTPTAAASVDPGLGLLPKPNRVIAQPPLPLLKGLTGLPLERQRVVIVQAARPARHEEPRARARRCSNSSRRFHRAFPARLACNEACDTETASPSRLRPASNCRMTVRCIRAPTPRHARPAGPSIQPPSGPPRRRNVHRRQVTETDSFASVSWVAPLSPEDLEGIVEICDALLKRLAEVLDPQQPVQP